MLAHQRTTPRGRRREPYAIARRTALLWLACALVLVGLELIVLRKPILAISAIVPLYLAWDAWRLRFPKLVTRTLRAADLPSLPIELQRAATEPPGLPLYTPLLRDRRGPRDRKRDI